MTILRDIQKRRQELLLKRQIILDKKYSQNQTILVNIPQIICNPPKNLIDVDKDISNCDTLTFFPICSSKASFTAIPGVTEQTLIIFTPDYFSTSSTIVPVVMDEIVRDFTYSLSSSSTTIPYVAQVTIVHISPDDSTTDSDCKPLSDFTKIEPMMTRIDTEHVKRKTVEGEF